MLAHLLLLASCAVPQSGPAVDRTSTIACLGDSITAGATLDDPGRFAWPAQLRARLNLEGGWQRRRVLAFGVGGATLIRAGDRPISGREEYRAAMGSGFDHLVVTLGTNDTVERGRGNWSKVGETGWEDDLERLLADARAARPGATVWLVGPPPMFPGQRGLSEERAAGLRERAPRLAELQARTAAFAAAADGVEHVSLAGALVEGRTTDGVHPDPFGHEAIARRLHRALGSALGLDVDPRDSVVPAPSAEHRRGAGWDGTWADAFGRLRELPFSGHAPPSVVFLGDSITQGLTGDADRWFELAGRPAVSLGLSGDRTEHLRYRIRQGALRWWTPELVVLQIGINNLNAAGHSAEDTAAGIEAVVADLRAALPWTRILVCGPFPAGRTRDDALRRAVDAVHERIRLLGEGSESKALGGARQVHYLDLRELFLTEDGAPAATMAGDALHISGAGKAAWRAAVQGWIEGGGLPPLVPGLPAPLAWFVDRDDHPLVSRTLVVLEPGAAAPRPLAQPILRTFDAHDPIDLVPLSRGGWAFNGRVARERHAPNEPSQLTVVEADGEIRGASLAPHLIAADPAGESIAAVEGQRLLLVDRRTLEVRALLDEQAFGRNAATALRWTDAGVLELRVGPLAGGTSDPARARIAPGVWRVDPATGAAEPGPSDALERPLPSPATDPSVEIPGADPRHEWCGGWRAVGSPLPDGPGVLVRGPDGARPRRWPGRMPRWGRP